MSVWFIKTQTFNDCGSCSIPHKKISYYFSYCQKPLSAFHLQLKQLNISIINGRVFAKFWRTFGTLPVSPLLTNGLRNSGIKTIFCQSNLRETWCNFSNLYLNNVYNVYSSLDCTLIQLLIYNRGPN